MDERYDPQSSRLDWSSAPDLRGADLYDNSGEKIGEVEDVYFDEQTHRPEWLKVATGWLGRTHIVPAVDLRRSTEGWMVPYSKDQVKDGPHGGSDVISQEQEDELYSYYGVDASRRPGAMAAPMASGMGTGVPTESPSSMSTGMAGGMRPGMAPEADQMKPPMERPTMERTDMEHPVESTMTPEAEKAAEERRAEYEKRLHMEKEGPEGEERVA